MGKNKSIKIDWDKVCDLLNAGCTQSEIAGFLRIDPRSLSTHCWNDHGQKWSDFAQSYDEGGKAMLRKKQFDKAMSGNTLLLVWLGKQRLNQYDKSAVSVIDGGNIDPSLLTDEQLKMLRDNPTLKLSDLSVEPPITDAIELLPEDYEVANAQCEG